MTQYVGWDCRGCKEHKTSNHLAVFGYCVQCVQQALTAQEERTKELAAANAFAAALREALIALKNEECWCGIGIGNPMMSRHSSQCNKAQAAIANT